MKLEVATLKTGYLCLFERGENPYGLITRTTPASRSVYVSSTGEIQYLPEHWDML